MMVTEALLAFAGKSRWCSRRIPAVWPRAESPCGCNNVAPRGAQTPPAHFYNQGTTTKTGFSIACCGLSHVPTPTTTERLARAQNDGEAAVKQSCNAVGLLSPDFGLTVHLWIASLSRQSVPHNSLNINESNSSAERERHVVYKAHQTIPLYGSVSWLRATRVSLVDTAKPTQSMMLNGKPAHVHTESALSISLVATLS